MPADSPPEARSFLRVEGDRAFVVKETIEKEVSLTTLAGELVKLVPQKSPAISTPNLPIGTRFYVQQGGYDFYVIEQAPRKRVMVTGPDGHPGYFEKQRHDAFAMPYTVFVIQTERGAKVIGAGQMRMFFTTSPVRSLEDKLYIAPLPNLDNRGTICVGNTPEGKGRTTAEAIEGVIANYWGSAFRYGGQSVFPGFTREGLFDNHGSHSDGKDFKHWSEQSAKNGDEWGMQVKWNPSGFNLGDAIQNPARGIG